MGSARTQTEPARAETELARSATEAAHEHAASATSHTGAPGATTGGEPKRAPRSDCHTILIVEDDAKIAAMLVGWVRALGMHAIVATTLEEVDRAIEEGGFCAVILDKEIPADGSSEPYVATGDTALRRLRAHDTRRTPDDQHVLPILVFTSKADSDVFNSRNFTLGASFFIRKPTTAEVLTGELLAALERGGRREHAKCTPAGGAKVVERAESIEIELDGIRPRRSRTSFLVNGKRRDLQDRLFVTLFRLATVRARGDMRFMSSGELGIHREAGIPSRIQEAVETALPEGFSLIQHGEERMWRLHPLVKVARIDWGAFEEHPHQLVQAIAAAERKRR